MSWTDVFPVLTDDLLQAYRQGVTVEERARYEEWLGVAEIFKAKRHGVHPFRVGNM